MNDKWCPEKTDEIRAELERVNDIYDNYSIMN